MGDLDTLWLVGDNGLIEDVIIHTITKSEDKSIINNTYYFENNKCVSHNLYINKKDAIQKAGTIVNNSFILFKDKMTDSFINLHNVYIKLLTEILYL